MKASAKCKKHTKRNNKGRGDKKKKTQPWCDSEDDRLFAAVKRLGCRNWIKIAEYVGHRTADQCCQRWYRALSPEIRKGVWSEKEDSLLVSFVKKFGAGSWKKIADGIPGRTDIQCRSRWIKIARKAQKAQLQENTEAPVSVELSPSSAPLITTEAPQNPQSLLSISHAPSVPLSLSNLSVLADSENDPFAHLHILSCLCDASVFYPLTVSPIVSTSPSCTQQSPSNSDKEGQLPTSPLSLARDRRMEIANLLNPDD